MASKKTKIEINVIGLILLVIVALYFFSIPPFDFDLGFGFKYNGSGEQIDPLHELIEGELSVSFIDVGQGDSIFIAFPDGKTMLIDGGDKGQEVEVLDFLAERNVLELDYVMLTHADSDHSGGLDDVISSSIKVNAVYMPYLVAERLGDNDPIISGQAVVPTEIKNVVHTPQSIDTLAYKEFVQAVINEGIDYSNIFYSLSGMTITGEGYRLTILSPTAEFYKDVKNSHEKNDLSPIVVIECNGKRVMLTGDAGEKAELFVVDNYKSMGYASIIDVDVLKLGHHGSSSSSTSAFMNLVKPEYAVICVGAGNTYGHPHDEVINRLNSLRINTFQTNIHGDIILSISQEELTFRVERQESYYRNEFAWI